MGVLSAMDSVAVPLPRRWTLEFSALPPGPNDRLTTFDRARKNREWRAFGSVLASNAFLPRGLARIRISVVFRRRNLGVADEDNDRARLKPVVDGLVSYGLIARDTRGHIEWGKCDEEHLRPGEQPGFRLTIEEVIE